MTTGVQLPALLVVTDDLKKEAAADPSRFIFAERAAPCYFDIASLDGEIDQLDVPAHDMLLLLESSERQVIWMENPTEDLTVALLSGHPFAYPDDELDFRLLSMIKCTKFETEEHVFEWLPPGTWHIVKK